MKQSQLFTKTRREAPTDEVSHNAQLLIRAGFIAKQMAGVYSYLPLGLKVLKKIEAIIRAEMNDLGGQELLLTTLQDAKVWQASGRWSDKAIDIWFKTQLKNGQEVGLGNTHEEPLAALLKHHVASYKDLPIYVYQIQTKFRNELRAKSGIMRVREFIMKDLYSFNTSEEEFREFYERCAQSYLKIFERCGIGDRTFRTFASGEPFSEFSDEFQTLSDAGEDIIYLDRRKGLAINKEIFEDDNIAKIGLDKESLEEHKAIEVGNIFPLGTRFSQAEGLYFIDEAGVRKPVVMGSYGIGLGRLMGTVAEVLNDEKGLIWPESIAPYKVHLIDLVKNERREPLGSGKTEPKFLRGAGGVAENMYHHLQRAGVEVLYDDRDVSAGEKFADADLIGIPYRVVISSKTLEQDSVEVKKRGKDRVEIVKIEQLPNFLARH